MEVVRAFWGALLGGLAGILANEATLGEWAEMMLCVVKQGFCWAMIVFVDDLPVMILLEDAIEALPEELPVQMAAVSTFYSALDTWVPVTEGLALWAAYGAFLAVVLGIRNVFRFIPTMS